MDGSSVTRSLKDPQMGKEKEGGSTFPQHSQAGSGNTSSRSDKVRQGLQGGGDEVEFT